MKPAPTVMVVRVFLWAVRHQRSLTAVAIAPASVSKSANIARGFDPPKAAGHIL